MPQPERETSEPEQIGARRIAEAVQNACIEGALRSYEDARMRGLCHEGAWEVAVGTLRSLDIEQIVNLTIQNRKSKI